MGKVQELKVPLYLVVGKKKKKNVWLNLNNYRNWQHHLNNQLKRQFKESVDLSHLQPCEGKVVISYTFYYPDARLRDIDNSMSVIAKFTQDALVESGILEDDNYLTVVEVTGRYGGIEKANPHCLIEIKEI